MVAIGSGRSRARRAALGLLVCLLLVATGLAVGSGLVNGPLGRARHDVNPLGGPKLPAPASSEQPCTRYARPTPHLDRLVNELRAGDVACLIPGTYGADGTRSDWKSSGTAAGPIRVRATGPGEVRVRGFVHLAGSYLDLQGLVFDGPTGPVDSDNTPSGEEVLVWIQGDHVSLSRSEVRDGLWRAGIYVTGSHTAIDACWIHDNGPWSDPHQQQVGGRADNIDHGVYWGKGSSGSLTNSLVEHNLAYGVQLSGGVRDVVVANNTIVRNGAGGVIWADDASASRLVNNIISFNHGYTVNAHLLHGRGNVMLHNLAWKNSFGEWNDNGPLRSTSNTTADPRFAGRRDYRLGPDSPAVAAGLAAGAPLTDILGAFRPPGQPPDLGAYQRDTVQPQGAARYQSPTTAPPP